MGALRCLGLVGLLAVVGCADDLVEEDPFGPDRVDDEVVDPPTGVPARCADPDGTFTSEDVVVLGRLGGRDEIGEGGLSLTFDAGAGTFSSTRDGAAPTEGTFATFADRIVLSGPLFDGVTDGAVLACALAGDRLRLQGPVSYDFEADAQEGGVRAELVASFVRAE